MRASAGLINAARLAGVPILPCTYAVSLRRVLASWDRFVLAFPFGRGVFLWGEPIAVAPDGGEAALERARATLEARLNALTREADLLCGAVPVEPSTEPASAFAEGS